MATKEREFHRIWENTEREVDIGILVLSERRNVGLVLKERFSSSEKLSILSFSFCFLVFGHELGVTKTCRQRA